MYSLRTKADLHQKAVTALEEQLVVRASGETSVTLEDCQLDIAHTEIAVDEKSMQRSHMRLDLRAYDSKAANLFKQENGITIITMKRAPISDQTVANAQAVLEKVPGAYSRQEPHTLTIIGNDGSHSKTQHLPATDVGDHQLRKLLQSPNGALVFNLSVSVPPSADGTAVEMQPHSDAPAFHEFVEAISADETLMEYSYQTNYLGIEAAPEKLLIAGVRVPPFPQLAAHSEDQAKQLAQALLQYSAQECR